MANISVPNTFVNNTQIADATQVNANFGAITTGLAAGVYDSYWANLQFSSALIGSGYAHFYSSVSFAGSGTFNAATYYNHNAQFNSSVSLPTGPLVSLGTQTGVFKVAAGVGAVATIVNADVSGSAAIAYSKLNLSGSIVNADVSSSAAIAITKIANGTANQIIGANSGASANEYKSLAVGTSGTDFAIAHSSNTITFNLPDASASNRGAITTGSQTIAGAKTFSGATIVNNTLTINGNGSNPGLTVSSANLVTIGVSGSTAQHVMNGGRFTLNSPSSADAVFFVNAVTQNQTARAYVIQEGTSTSGAAYWACQISGGSKWSAGLDTANSSQYCIAATDGFGTASSFFLRISTTGTVTLGADSATPVHKFNAATQTTVGAAGAASALPANPTGYIELNINGTARVIPYYAKS